MLGTAQPFRLLGTEGRRNGAIRPGQPPFRGLVSRPKPWRRDRENAAVSFDQNVADIGGGGRDEGDPAGPSRSRLMADPFCQGAGLAKAPTRKQQPNLPIPRWRQLVGTRDRRPGSPQRISELRGEWISHSRRLAPCDHPEARAQPRWPSPDRATPQSRPPAPPDTEIGRAHV